MATKYKLSWRTEQGGRWRKRYDGKDYYFPIRDGETKATSYKRCWQAWLEKKAEVDAFAEAEDPDSRAWQSLIKKVAAMLSEIEGEDTPENRQAWSTWYAQLSTYQYLLKEGLPYPFMSDAEWENPESVPLMIGGGQMIEAHSDAPPPPWEEVDSKPEVEPSKTLQGNVDRFLAYKRQQVERGQLSAGRFDSIRVGLELFVSHCKAGCSIESVNTPVMSSYKDKLEGMVDDNKLRPHTAKDRLQSAKQFIKWAWEQELLDLPRVIESREFTIAVPEQKIETFTTDEIRRLLDSGTEKTRLYLLLMLNLGATQQDISDLTQNEVDWKTGRVNRKRSKTRKRNGKSVPTVDYKLWPETFRLLKKYRSKDTDLVLTNAKGTPLKVETIVDGKVHKIDNIRSAYNRLVRGLAQDKNEPIKIDKSLKLFRKTAASKLGEHAEYGKFAQHFLGHAPQTVADKHYVAPSGDQFDRAVSWLGEQFLK